MTVAPGSTIGIVGGGQLGRMLAVAAAQLGYKAHIYSPEASGPATEVAAYWTRGAYDDREAIRRFGEQVDVVTYEFENVDPHAVADLAAFVPLRPSCLSLEVSRYRPKEKEFVQRLGGRCADYRVVETDQALHGAIDAIGAPSILKTCMLGYDGKGQASIGSPEEAEAAWSSIGRTIAILERRIDFIAEFSVILCRGLARETVVWAVPQNVHEAGILRTSAVPARADLADQVAEAIALSRLVADRLDHVGVLTLEFFATPHGPLFNEMAPRVHNSGHWTIEGALTSQFENHIRAICGLPLGATDLVAPSVSMRNLLGDEADAWMDILLDPAARLHLYGKTEARPGRKMGHVTRLG
jgi:5-(carboxyamino)imidazole ribonucleotide synthase